VLVEGGQDPCLHLYPVASRNGPPMTEEPAVTEEHVREAIDVARNWKLDRRCLQDVAALAVGDDDLVVALNQVDLSSRS
jgi:hypothetical protein